MISCSRSMYPGEWEVMELGIWEMSSTPFRRSSMNISLSSSQIRFVRGVAGARNAPSPS
jgi:hypothetical protein